VPCLFGVLLGQVFGGALFAAFATLWSFFHHEDTDGIRPAVIVAYHRSVAWELLAAELADMEVRHQ
jgi:hypothetical protein